MTMSKSSLIPFLVPRCKVSLTPTARVPYSNAANLRERRTGTQSEFRTWQNSVRGQKPPKNVYNVPAHETAEHHAKFGWPPLSDVEIMSYYMPVYGVCRALFPLLIAFLLRSLSHSSQGCGQRRSRSVLLPVCYSNSIQSAHLYTTVWDRLRCSLERPSRYQCTVRPSLATSKPRRKYFHVWIFYRSASRRIVYLGASLQTVQVVLRSKSADDADGRPASEAESLLERELPCHVSYSHRLIERTWCHGRPLKKFLEVVNQKSINSCSTFEVLEAGHHRLTFYVGCG